MSWASLLYGIFIGIFWGLVSGFILKKWPKLWVTIYIALAVLMVAVLLMPGAKENFNDFDGISFLGSVIGMFIGNYSGGKMAEEFK